MSSADQIKALLKSHAEGDEERFYSVAMQVAAHEARAGHGKLASELRSLIDDAKSRRTQRDPDGAPTPIGKPRGALAEMLSVSYPKARLSSMVLGDTLAAQLQRIVKEQRHFALIREHGLAPRRKLLLVGPPGTGKTLTATVLSGELGLPLYAVRQDALISKLLGETAAKLRQVFDAMAATRGIYFFDEFDALGSGRGLTNDVGEIRRVLNSFLLMIEQDQSNSLIVAATNHPEILDYALFRRFDDVLHYDLPGPEQIQTLLAARLQGLAARGIRWDCLAESAQGLSYAEIARVADESIKDALIHERKRVTETDIGGFIAERQTVASRLAGR
jgi:SpoVK/Ycf46/Vps4 family AAA+-type ATPase